MAKYSLSDYQLTISSDDAEIRNLIGDIIIGGNGDATESMTYSYTNANWSVTGYATGAYVLNKSYDRTGEISVSISQVSDNIPKLIRLCNLYLGGNNSTLTMSLKNQDDIEVMKATGVVPQKIPQQDFQNAVRNQNWTFEAGVIEAK